VRREERRDPPYDDEDAEQNTECGDPGAGRRELEAEDDEDPGDEDREQEEPLKEERAAERELPPPWQGRQTVDLSRSGSCCWT